MVISLEGAGHILMLLSFFLEQRTCKGALALQKASGRRMLGIDLA